MTTGSATTTAAPFEILPAIDVLGGRCVRLLHGDPDNVTIEGGDPTEAARRFVELGTRWLHVVDLDGAFSGEPTAGLVARIRASAPSTPIQVGGGYRTLDAVGTALDAGATRVMVGTAALDPAFLAEAVARFGDGIVVAVDAKDGMVASHGWQEASEVPATELAARCAQAGVACLLVTSTRRDGSLEGPDLPLLESVIQASGLPVLAAGGIASVDDLTALRRLGCAGGILGSALWTGRVPLPAALAAASAPLG